METRKNKRSAGPVSEQPDSPKNESLPDNINVGVAQEGSDLDPSAKVQKVDHVQVVDGRMAFSLKDVAIPPRSAEPYKDVVGTLAYRNAKKNEFFRVRADPKWKAQIGITLDVAGDAYLVGPAVMNYLDQERLLLKVDAFTLISKDSKDIYLSGIGVKDPLQKENSWNSSRRRAYQMAETRWIRIVANHETSTYTITEALGDIPEPHWPDDKIPSLEFALNRVFENRFVDTMSHDVIKSIAGKRL